MDATEESAGPQGNGVIDLVGDDHPQARAGRGRRGSTRTPSRPPTRAITRTRTVTRAGAARSRCEYERDGGVRVGRAFEHEVIRPGHYPEARSENKGSEPEGARGRDVRRPHPALRGRRARQRCGRLRRHERYAAVRAAAAHRHRPGGHGRSQAACLAVSSEVDGRGGLPGAARASPSHARRLAAPRAIRTSSAPTGPAASRSRGWRCRAWPATPTTRTRSGRSATRSWPRRTLYRIDVRARRR